MIEHFGLRSELFSCLASLLIKMITIKLTRLKNFCNALGWATYYLHFSIMYHLNKKIIYRNARRNPFSKPTSFWIEINIYCFKVILCRNDGFIPLKTYQRWRGQCGILIALFIEELYFILFNTITFQLQHRFFILTAKCCFWWSL